MAARNIVLTRKQIRLLMQIYHKGMRGEDIRTLLRSETARQIFARISRIKERIGL